MVVKLKHSSEKCLICSTFAAQIALESMKQTLGAIHRKGGQLFPIAVTHVGKLGGLSQPSIVLTTGCKFYVVKCQDFAGCYGLMKEVIGTELMSWMRLPVPDWAPVLLTEEFIDQNPGLWFRDED